MFSIYDQNSNIGPLGVIGGFWWVIKSLYVLRKGRKIEFAPKPNPNPNVGGMTMPNVGGMAMVATISLIAYKLIAPKHIKNDYEEVGQKHIKSDFEEIRDKYNSDSLPFYFKKFNHLKQKYESSHSICTSKFKYSLIQFMPLLSIYTTYQLQCIYQKTVDTILIQTDFSFVILFGTLIERLLYYLFGKCVIAECCDSSYKKMVSHNDCELIQTGITIMDIIESYPQIVINILQEYFNKYTDDYLDINVIKYIFILCDIEIKEYGEYTEIKYKEGRKEMVRYDFKGKRFAMKNSVLLRTDQKGGSIYRDMDYRDFGEFQRLGLECSVDEYNVVKNFFDANRFRVIERLHLRRYMNQHIDMKNKTYVPKWRLYYLLDGIRWIVMLNLLVTKLEFVKGFENYAVHNKPFNSDVMKHKDLFDGNTWMNMRLKDVLFYLGWCFVFVGENISGLDIAYKIIRYHIYNSKMKSLYH